MTAPAFVATLIAPAGAALTDENLYSSTEGLEKTGCKVTLVKMQSARQAADIFFMPATQDPPSPRGQGLGRGSTEAQADAFDLIIQPAATRAKKILIADMESTIIEQEMLDELALEIGAGEKVADITRRAMNGELDFAAALHERVSLLKGQPESLLAMVAQRMRLMPGAQALLDSMKAAGAKTWLVSGGFTCFVKIIADQLGFDCYFANELVIEDGYLTGKVKPPILDKNSKKTLLEKACADYGLPLAEALAVGDGANDIPMLQRCNEGGGLGVAFRAKPRVRGLIHQQINHGDLTALIHAQGLFL